MDKASNDYIFAKNNSQRIENLIKVAQEEFEFAMSSDLLSQREKDEFKESHDKFIKELHLLKEKPFFSEDNEEIKDFLLRATTLRLMKQQQRKNL